MHLNIKNRLIEHVLLTKALNCFRDFFDFNNSLFFSALSKLLLRIKVQQISRNLSERALIYIILKYIRACIIGCECQAKKKCFFFFFLFRILGVRLKFCRSPVSKSSEYFGSSLLYINRIIFVSARILGVHPKYCCSPVSKSSEYDRTSFFKLKTDVKRV